MESVLILEKSMSKDKKQNKIQVDQESLRGYLKELSKEPHIAAGRRDKWAGIWIDMEWNQTKYKR